MSTRFPFSEMRTDDYDAVISLWRACEGVGLTPADSREAVAAFLARNPGLSLVVRQHDRIVGAVLCGHDGRRGYLYHLAVAAEYRKRGLARRLVTACLRRLWSAGIQKATIFVYAHNESGQQFWRQVGWHDRADLLVLQRETPTQS